MENNFDAVLQALWDTIGDAKAKHLIYVPVNTHALEMLLKEFQVLQECSSCSCKGD